MDARAHLGELFRWLFAAAAMLILFLPLTVMARKITDDHVALAEFGLFLTFWVAAAAIHELGRAAFARAAGWNVHVVSVGFSNYLPARRAFARLPGGRRRFFGGYVFATPPRPDQWMKLGHLGFILGGAIANAVSAIVVLELLWLIAARDSAVTIVGAGFATFSLFFAAFNLFPLYGPGRQRNDGALAVDFIIRRREPAAIWAKARICGLQFDQVPPRAWDGALIAQIDVPGVDAHWLGVAETHYFAVGATVKALDAARRLEVLRPGSTAPTVMAFLVALVERDTAAARAVLAKAGEPQGHDFGGWRALAVILAVEGRHDEARAAVTKARETGAREPGGAGDDDDKVLLAAIMEGRALPVQFGAAA